MPITKCNPDVVHPPAGNYSHVAIVPAGHRLLYLAGQLGMQKDGTVPEAVEDQFEQALLNILHIVESQGGSAEDVAKLTFFYAEEPTDRSRHGKALRNVRRAQARHDVHPCAGPCRSEVQGRSRSNRRCSGAELRHAAPA